ncbi:MAG: M28 family peptidase [Sphingobacteriaceae bacterium]|nr:M28 family peptidase [Sphingobacteriaceae bacterium]
MKSRLYKVALSLALALSCTVVASGQDLVYARQQLDTLASEAFHGRGYVARGQQLAAEYLLREFQRLGLQPLSDNYLQPFSLEVNSFDSVLLRINGRTLVPGIDYLLYPKSGYGEAKKLKSGNKTAIFNYQNPPKSGKPSWEVLLETGHPKLTWSVGRETWPLPYFQLSGAATPQKIKTISYVVRGNFRAHQAANVIGYLEGSSNPDSVLVICAHYDHLGRMGSTLFPGANDNASGTALLLDLARHYSRPENTPAYSLLFIAFGAEEAGLVGSTYYVNNPILPLNRISLVLNLDLMAGGSQGLMMVNALKNPAAYQALDSLNKAHSLLSSIQKRDNAANSDHYPFSQKGVPAVFLYTMGDVTAYHDPNDRAEKLQLQHYPAVFELLQRFIQHWPNRIQP